VSLTSELADPSSPLARYLTARFPHRTAIADAYAAAVGNAPTVAPAAGGGYPWALVGSAFGHRLGFAFAADPPYASLLGATHLTDTEQVAHLAAAQFATAARLAAGQVHRAGYVRVVAGGRCPPLTSALGRLGLAATAEALRALTPKAVGEDLWRLTVALAERGYDQLVTLGRPVTVAPLFVQAWADGDLVLGATLVDVKVTKNPLPLRDAWLDQLLGYTLLDYGDWYGLEQVAVFLGRQARLVAWPLAELLPALTGDPRVTVAELRAEFYGLLERIWANNRQFPFHHLWVTRTSPP